MASALQNMSCKLRLHELLIDHTDLFKCLKDYGMPELQMYEKVFPHLSVQAFEPGAVVLTQGD